MNIRYAITAAAIVAAVATSPGGCGSTGTAPHRGAPGQPENPAPTSTIVPKGATGYCTNGQYVFDTTHLKRLADCERQGAKLAEEQR